MTDLTSNGMKIRIFFALGFFAFFALGIVTWSQAQGDGGRKVVAPDQVIEGDYAAAGEIVEISGVVKGDAYVAAAQVLVNGVVEGDLLALGGTVSISGTVGQNVRVGGWQVILSGDVGRNVTVGAMNFEVTRSAELGGSLVAGGSTTVLNGSVAKSARVAGRNLTVTSTIEGDVEAAVENIRLVPGAEVHGDFTYWSNRDASIGEGVSIQGNITRKAAQGPGMYVEQFTKPASQLIRPFLGIVSFLSSLVLGLLLLRFFPDYARQTVLTLRNRKWHSFTTGITTLLVVPVVFGLLIITIVGIPLGIVLLMVSSLILYIARIFVMLWIGMVIAEKLNKQISDAWAFVIGLVLYSILVQVPVAGWIISFLVVLLGLGAAAHTLKEKYFSSSSKENEAV